ncbi:N,N-dimethylformamidase beta subunit family domain-containing protein [Arenibaculum sp.]|uniref:N,N-dimethylformamidase beta subunit family domain-containing protein n=1 Tax=Arenibaculum sp. TaxID=2865862 RepID=UPI002E152372|nr:N,N-dimethylformamidase beta subunit family domain-containing protein [Arenibaculum sp.]
MYEIDPSRLDLAREFKRRPLGAHSPDLQAVLDRMRSMPIEGKHCLIVTKPHAQWLLARMSGTPPMPVPVPGIVFTDPAEAEWTVFKLRWQALTGHDLASALVEPALPPPSAEPVAAPDPSRAILAYADTISVAPGQTVDVKVSCLGVETYRADLVRLRAPQSGPDGEGYREDEVPTPASGIYRGRVQPLRLGSHLVLPALEPPPESFTVQVLAWPTRLASGEQALVGTWSQATRRGFSLCLDAAGALALRLGDGAGSVDYTTGVPLVERHWYLLAASFDAASGIVDLHQLPIGGHGFRCDGPVSVRHAATIEPTPGDASLLVAAWHGGDADGVAPGGHFNGKLERPRIARAALALADIERLASDADCRDFRDVLVAAPDFSQDIGSDRVVDLSPRQGHGSAVNQPTRAVTGHNWDGRVTDWRLAPGQYGAIHFHEDDVDDASWQTDIALTIPQTLRSGVYAMRLRGDGAETHVPFFVRPPAGTVGARVAFLAPTATYTIYANNRSRFLAAGTEMLRGHLLDFDVTDMRLLQHRLGLSTYCLHSDGSGVCYGTRLRPMTNFRPKGRLWNFSSDLFVIDWLEQTGCGYDVITDDDLHEHGAALLAPYRTVVTGSHPEYASLEMLDALETYLKAGGRMMYLGGNGFYWRIAYRPGCPGVVEVRRAEDGTRAWNAAPGEYHMSFTGEQGGLWSRQGRPPNAIAGVGFIAQGFDVSSYYRRRADSRDPRAAFIFAGIDDEILGDFGHLGGGAAGEELDAFDVGQGSPAHPLVVASSERHPGSFHLANDAVLVPNAATSALHSERVRADMVFFECPNGGAVFSTGSIAYAGALSHDGYDNNIARLTRNVLERFLDPAPFPMPGQGRR